jgi:uncharacterized protein (TIGR02118 family)
LPSVDLEEREQILEQVSDRLPIDPGALRGNVETARILDTAQGETTPYHRVAELWFDNFAQLQAAVVSAEGQALEGNVADFATGFVIVLVDQADESGAAMLAGTPAV